MEQGNAVVSKILLLLNKVKEALIQDLQKEFVQVREAVANFNQDSKDKSISDYVDGMCNIVDTVFARVGYDISHYENLDELKAIVLRLIDEAEALSTDLQQTVKDFEEDQNLDGDEVAAMLDKVVPRIKSIIELIKTVSDVEWEEISKELASASNTVEQSIEEQFLNKKFARQILDYILMTLLKNAKEVFKDEIDYVKMSIENHITALKDSVEDVTRAISKEVNAVLNDINIGEIEDVLKETLQDAQRLYNKVDDELKANVKNAIESSSDALNVRYNDGYRKLARALSITYSILDFLGVLKEKEITLQIPEKIKKLIQEAEDAIQDVNEDIKNSLKVTQQATGMGLAALSTTGIQLQTIDLFFSHRDNSHRDNALKTLETLQSGFSEAGETVINIADDISNTLQSKLDSIQNFSYPIKLTVLNWQSMESLFTKPVQHFKKLYPIHSVADAEDVMRRLMGILHQINPDIPDFDSLKGLLEELLKKLQRRLIQLVNELKEEAKGLAQEIWEKFQPLITTIRKVIDMLKELAMALKEKMTDVLNEVKDSVKVVVSVVQDQLEEIGSELNAEIKEVAKKLNQAGSALKDGVEDVLQDIDDKAKELTGKIKDGLNEVGNQVEDTLDEMGDQANSLLGEVADEIRNAVGKMPSFNLPKAIKNSLAEPLTDAVSDAFKKAEIDLDLTPFVELSNEKNELVASFKRLNNKLQEAPQLQLAIALPSLDDAFVGAFPDVLGIVQEEAIQPLQLWAYGVVKSVKTVTDIDVWKSRLDNLISQLQEEFKNDMGNITGLISKEGAMKLFNDSASVKEQLESELDINDYITILHTAVDDVVLPNPEYFFTSFKKTLQTIFSNLTARLLKEYQNLKEKLNEDFESMVEAFKENFDRFYNQVQKAGGELSEKAKAILEDVKAIVENVKALFEKMKEVFKTIKELPGNLVEQLKNGAQELLNNLATAFVDGLEELASNIWKNIKTQVIMPLINHIKNQILHCIKEIIRKVLRKLVEGITEIKEDIDEAKDALLDKLPILRDLQKAQQEFVQTIKSVIGKSAELEAKVKEVLPEGRITNLNQLPAVLSVISQDQGVKKEFENLSLTFHRTDGEPIRIPYYYINMAQSMVSATLDFVQSDMSVKQIIKLVVALYKGIPDEVKDKVMDILPDLPELPDNAFTEWLGDVTYTYDLDNRMCNVTLLNLKPENGTDAVEREDIDLNYYLTLQLFMFVGVYGKKADAAFDELDGNGTALAVIDEEEEEEDESVPALYFILHLRGNLKVVFSIGENHFFKIELEGGIGDAIGADKEVSDKSLGFCMTEKDAEKGITSVFHGLGSAKSLDGIFMAKFSRNNGEDTSIMAEPANLLSTKYLDIKIGNYPQTLYLLYNHEYPSDVVAALNLQEDDEHVDGFSVGYLAKLEDVEFVLKLRHNEFFKQVLKDDIAAKFTVSVLYDYLRGFKLGGGYNFHCDIDCSNLKLGSLNLQSIGVDLGSLKNDWGTLNLGLGSTFSVQLDAISFSFENIGLGMNLNVVKPDFSLGDWDFGFNFKFPDGIGISIDTAAVKGAGLISYTDSTGELMGVLELDVVDKFGVSALLFADLGTVEGHSFSLMAMISARFSPGIPLGMGFSLTAIGGALGLQRMLDRGAITTAVRQGTLDSVFFVEDVGKHLAEMKKSCEEIFPAKEGQFFLGLLAQISYEPVVRCNFGLFLQLPKPLEIIIVGALKVGIKDLDIIRINVYFAGGINFEEGIWFDASLVDSEIVGIKLEGDMAFRLFWGGNTKGFLLSVGGFHPNYQPEEGMMVTDMKRLAMKLDYSLLKVSMETYLAVTSNSFQIGAYLDICVGWNKFGIRGYAGFDALFQFNPFMFMFSIEAGVSVVCGSWKLMSIDLGLSLSGPSPWNAKGDASFWFLLIPIEVGFNITWGDSKPQLPEKQIEVLPLLKNELQNPSNWMQGNGARKDREVYLFNSETEEFLTVLPIGELSFNQSVIPLEEKKLDMCNHAVPTDYDRILVKYVTTEDKRINIADENLEVNEFAPALYYLMSHKEKLKSPSYISYKSGFKVEGGYTSGKCQTISLEAKVTIGVYRTSGDEETSTRNTTINVTEYTNSRVAYQKTSKAAFDRYVDLLDTL